MNKIISYLGFKNIDEIIEKHQRLRHIGIIILFLLRAIAIIAIFRSIFIDKKDFLTVFLGIIGFGLIIRFSKIIVRFLICTIAIILELIYKPFKKNNEKGIKELKEEYKAVSKFEEKVEVQKKIKKLQQKEKANKQTPKIINTFIIIGIIGSIICAIIGFGDITRIINNFGQEAFLNSKYLVIILYCLFSGFLGIYAFISKNNLSSILISIIILYNFILGYVTNTGPIIDFIELLLIGTGTIGVLYYNHINGKRKITPIGILLLSITSLIFIMVITMII